MTITGSKWSKSMSIASPVNVLLEELILQILSSLLQSCLCFLLLPCQTLNISLIFLIQRLLGPLWISRWSSIRCWSRWFLSHGVLVLNLLISILQIVTLLISLVWEGCHWCRNTLFLCTSLLLLKHVFLKFNCLKIYSDNYSNQEHNNDEDSTCEYNIYHIIILTVKLTLVYTSFWFSFAPYILHIFDWKCWIRWDDDSNLFLFLYFIWGCFLVSFMSHF